LTTPEDVRSAIGTAPITISFDAEPTDAQVSELTAQLQLRTFPILTPVPFTTTVRVTDQQGRPVSGSHDPVLPILKFIDVTPGGDSRHSSPVLRQVQLTNAGLVEVSFSEPIVFDPGVIASALRLDAPDGSACSLVQLPTIGQAYVRFSFDCSASAWASQAVNVAVSPGLKSATGVNLGVLRDKGCAASPLTGALNLHLDFTSANACSTGCKELSIIEPDTTPPQVTASVDPT
jgi:hypothetical protein